jgi:hypothetical protein
MAQLATKTLAATIDLSSSAGETTLSNWLSGVPIISPFFQSQLDTEPKAYPDTLLRYNLLQRRMAVLSEVNTKAVLNLMASHSGGESAVCCHHNREAPATEQYETLSTVVLDLASGNLIVKSGGPCTFENQ